MRRIATPPYVNLIAKSTTSTRSYVSLSSFGDFQKSVKSVQKQLETVSPETMQTVNELLNWKEEQLETVTRQATKQALQILNTIDEECDEDTEASVNFTIGIASVTLTRKID